MNETKTKKIDLTETGILNSYANYLSSENYVPIPESYALIAFKNAFECMVQFLKFSKHSYEHTVIKAVDLDGEFILALEVSLDTDSDGNKSWVTGMIFDENEIEMTDKTKVFSTSDSTYILSFKKCSERLAVEINEQLKAEDIFYLSTKPLVFLINWGNQYFENLNENEIEVEIENVCIIKFSLNRSSNKLSISGSLHQNLKQAIKSDGRTDAIEEETNTQE